MSELIRINVRVSPEVHSWFKERSERTGVSMSSLMFLACEKYMQEQMFMGTNLPKLLALAKELGIQPDLESMEQIRILNESFQNQT